VDDDRDTCRNLADILTDMGYRVDTAPDGPSALELVRRNPYDVALLDFKMPGMNGLELYREVKKLRAGTVAIIISAYTNNTTRDEAIGAGAWQVLAKPVDLTNLLGLVDDADLCATLWDVLREKGYRVCLSNNANAAADRVREQVYSVVLIDMQLPDGNGSDVFHTVRDANPQAHTIVITGHPRELGGLVEQVIKEGADAVCYKPFDVPALLSILDRLTKPGPANRPEG
jgi:DNA-binding NtrC family response regulator